MMVAFLRGTGIELKGTYDDRVEVAPGAWLAFGATWHLPAFLFAGFHSGGDAHRWDSGTGVICRRAGVVYPRGRTLSTRCQGCSLAGSRPDKNVGYAWHITLP